MTAALAPVPDRIVCSGQPFADDGTPVGKPCGRRYHTRCTDCHGGANQHAATLIERARAAGWRIGPGRPDGTHPAMCPQCARPDPGLLASIRDIRRGLLGAAQGVALVAIGILVIVAAIHPPAEESAEPLWIRMRSATTAESLLRDLRLQRDLDAALNAETPGIASAGGSTSTYRR